MGEAVDHLKDNSLVIIIVTSDHVMPFPRVKGNYEEGFSVPLIVVWKNKIKSGRTTDFVTFPDQTLLDLTGIPIIDQMTGKSFKNNFTAEG